MCSQGGKRKQDGSIKSPRDGLKPALTLRLNDVHKSAPAALAQPSVSLEPSPQKAEIKVEAAPSAAPTVTAAARPEQGPGPIAGGCLLPTSSLLCFVGENPLNVSAQCIAGRLMLVRT